MAVAPPLPGAPRPCLSRSLWRWSRPAVGDRFEDLDRGGASVGQRVGRGLADLLPRDSAAQGGAWRIHVDGGAAFLARGEQEGDLVLIAGEPDRHGHPGAHDTLGPGRVAYLSVLPQVALVPGGLDLLRDLHTRGASQMVELRLQPVVCFLGEPGDVLACLGHGYSLPALRTDEVRWSQPGPMGYWGPLWPS